MPASETPLLVEHQLSVLLLYLSKVMLGERCSLLQDKIGDELRVAYINVLFWEN